MYYLIQTARDLRYTTIRFTGPHGRSNAWAAMRAFDDAQVGAGYPVHDSLMNCWAVSTTIAWERRSVLVDVLNAVSVQS
jgi:hypothetical protein